MTSAQLQKRAPGKHKIVALSLAGVVAGMLGLSYAAVPLYKMFCQVTGFGGTTQRAETSPDQILDRKIKVRFDANLAKGMGWKFRPAQTMIELKIGETALAFYEASNASSKPVRGTATFNVTPEACRQLFQQN